MTLRDALATPLHREWERRVCEPGEPGVQCFECGMTADAILTDPAFRAALTEAVADGAREARWWEHGGDGSGPNEWTAGELARAIVARMLGEET